MLKILLLQNAVPAIHLINANSDLIPFGGNIILHEKKCFYTIKILLQIEFYETSIFWLKTTILSKYIFFWKIQIWDGYNILVSYWPMFSGTQYFVQLFLTYWYTSTILGNITPHTGHKEHRKSGIFFLTYNFLKNTVYMKPKKCFL